MEKKKYTNGKWVRPYSNKLLSECINVLDKRNIKYEICKSKYVIKIFIKSGTYVRYWITTDRWMNMHTKKNKQAYSCKDIYDLLDRFLFPKTNDLYESLTKFNNN